ncbi:DUF1501 domain-containing protein [Jannaschia seohaensis]|uniref:Uncharacterized conserved protein, DUF1501 family n=1 Tax=Jannaschia seohaensis TaxID=475081 RepID=A0A2Y9B0F4_9RHOB|nr:DUF1501 domain-containing protein [Jannaschia seohaensis]PWJ17020.1 uncharacterized protein (DUF1501 family) [Jannaschia seohaensis]SSA48357.1 Uncharacterized conserved protein, DUF1501 family [Jannaschia seohaensis]
MLDRRRFLTTGACSLAAAPLVSPMAFASLPSDHRLVVVILRGAMDGLDVLQPYGDPDLARLRPEFAIGPAAGALDLTGFHAMHPGLEDLLPLWRAGELGFAQAVSTPYRDGRSHFDGQDILEAGTAGEVPPMIGRDGWLNRLLGVLPGVEGRTAFAIGREDMLLLRGAAPHAAWAPDARLEMAAATRDLLTHIYHDDPLFRDRAAEALRLSAQGPSAKRGQGDGVEALFGFAASQLAADSRIAALSLAGWDTHRRQDRALLPPLRRLARGILTLRDGLGPVWARTTVLAMTEFGRTAAHNGTRGTDHGTGGAMIAAGGAIAGGQVWGGWPGLAEADLLDRRDLMPLRDVRAYAAWALHGLFGVDRGVLSRVVFPGLEMGTDPGLLA